MSQQIAVSQLCQRHNTKYYYQRQWHILLFQSVYLYARVLHVCLCMCMCGQSGPRGAKSPHFDFYLPINVWPSVEQLKQPTTDHKWLVVVACRAVVVAVWRCGGVLAFTVIVCAALWLHAPPILSIKFLWFLKNMFIAVTAPRLASAVYQLLPRVCLCVYGDCCNK